MSKLKYKIESDNISLQEISVVSGAKFQFKKESDQVFYRKTLKSDLVLNGAAYSLLSELSDACEVVAITIERFCDGDYAEYWTGYFTKFDCTFDEGRCNVSVKPRPTDDYKCLFEKWDKTQNIYGTPVAIVPFLGTYETLLCPSPSLPCAGLTDGTWCLDTVQFEVYYYHHVVAPGTCSGGVPSPPDNYYPWTLKSGTSCPNPIYYRCPDLAEGDNLSPYEYGRRFDVVLQELLDATGCGLTAVSHFFGIGTGIGSRPNNIAYDYAEKWLENLTIHQKSDVKRPNASDHSTQSAWDMKLKDLIDDFRKIFNVYFKVSGSNFIIEHISYFEGTPGIDISTTNIRRRYSYEQQGPKTERWEWLDSFSVSSFSRPTLEYGCGNGDQVYKVSLFSTDIEVISNPLYADVISDSGFVLISNSINGTGGYIINQLNQPLGFVNLLTNLHRHNRPFETYKMNAITTVTALSVQRIKKLDGFSIKFCCTDEFSPDNIITTSLGSADVSEAEYDISKEILTLDLLI